MRTTYYLLISFLLFARAILFFIQHKQIGHRRNDNALAGMFVLFAASYAVYASRAPGSGPGDFLFWLELALDGAIGFVSAYETIRAYLNALKIKGGK